MRLDSEDKDTSYTRSRRQIVTIGKITDEQGVLDPRYRCTPFEPALAAWLEHVRLYADAPNLSRINAPPAVRMSPNMSIRPTRT